MKASKLITRYANHLGLQPRQLRKLFEQLSPADQAKSLASAKRTIDGITEKAAAGRAERALKERARAAGIVLADPEINLELQAKEPR